MTDIDGLLEKVKAFGTAVSKQPMPMHSGDQPKMPCPEGQKMVDGACIEINTDTEENEQADNAQEKSMTEGKPPEKTVEKKPEGQATPAPAVPNAVPDKVDTRIEGMETKITALTGTLNSICLLYTSDAADE